MTILNFFIRTEFGIYFVLVCETFFCILIFSLNLLFVQNTHFMCACVSKINNYVFFGQIWKQYSTRIFLGTHVRNLFWTFAIKMMLLQSTSIFYQWLHFCHYLLLYYAMIAHISPMYRYHWH